jgi:hypothetical protein
MSTSYENDVAYWSPGSSLNGNWLLDKGLAAIKGEALFLASGAIVDRIQLYQFTELALFDCIFAQPAAVVRDKTSFVGQCIALLLLRYIVKNPELRIRIGRNWG